MTAEVEHLIRSAREYVESLFMLRDALSRGDLADPQAIDRTIRRTISTLDHALDLLSRPAGTYPLQRGDHGSNWPYPGCPAGGACED